MKILIVTTNFWPEPTGISVYTTDLAESLKAAGNSVTVLTGLPHYPWWKIPNEYKHLTVGLYDHNGMKVLRVNHLIPSRMNALIRIQFEISLWWNLRRVSKKFLSSEFDLVLACIPTVAAGLVGKRIAKRFNLPFGLIVQDLSGEGAKQSGLRGGALISKIARAVEGKALKAAKGLVVVSPAMGDAVLKMHVPGERINFIPNYSAKEIRQYDKVIARQRLGWHQSEFVVIHSGNMGAKQGLENVVEASRFLKQDSKIKIRLIGHGNRERELQESSAGLPNVEVLPAVSEEDYPYLLSAADLLLVNERPTQLDMSLPSKLTSYLFSGRPVLAAVPRKGATWKYLDGIAELVDAGKPEQLADALEELSGNSEKRIQLAKKGLEFARVHLDPEIGREKYLDWVENLIESKHG